MHNFSRPLSITIASIATRINAVKSAVFFILISWLILSGPTFAEAPLYENEFTQKLAQTVTLGEVVWLDVGGQKVFSVYAPAKAKNTRGAVVLLHDLDSHAVWPEVIAPLLSQLPLSGWSILSVQLPMIEQRDAKTLSTTLGTIDIRIKAALDYLASKNIPTIALLGHGYGALAAAAYIAENKNDTLKGFVAIGFPLLENGDSKLNSLTLIPRISIPVFDIFGSLDDENVLNNAEQRAFLGKLLIKDLESNNSAAASQRTTARPAPDKILYRQLRVAGADHFFRDQGFLLAKYIAGWLERTLINKQ